MKILALDVSLRNAGLAKLVVNPTTLDIHVEEIKLIKTVADKSKTIRKNSDDLRAARELYREILDFGRDCQLYAAEIPSGTQSARGAMSNGIVLGVFGALAEHKHLIEVTASEAKKIATGRRTATKDEMIQWAVQRYPNADWLRYKKKGVLYLNDSNEHLADAVAIGHAALNTPEFKSALAILK